MKIQNEEAVSPVIGVILMVAITVILAAVIAAFVFGLAGTTGSSKNVGVTVSENETGYLITWQGGVDLGKITEFSVKNDTEDKIAVGESNSPSVGQVNFTEGKSDNEHILIVAAFDDGSEQVIFDKRF
ncbi:MAG TPA: type IV pilin N-terminal domain-containing protein [Methanoregulaceae archaeon]|nr:type IV pilin N-terminal domain-containing protein [Methanoregulaceae archaeon]